MVEARLCSAEAELVHATAEEFLGRQTFELRRRQGTTAIYRQRRDVMSKLRRAADIMGEIQLDCVESVTLTVSPVGAAAVADDMPEAETSVRPRCMVRIEATLKPGRRAVMTGAAGSGAVLAGASGSAALLTGDAVWIMAGGPGGAAIAGVRFATRRRWQRRHIQDATEILATLLEVLEERS